MTVCGNLGLFMSEKRCLGVNRNQIPWYPIIDYDKCVADCTKCVKFCGLGVFEFKGEEGKVCRSIVKNPYACTVLCDGCVRYCPANAISFPSREDTKKLIAKLRESKSEIGNDRLSTAVDN